MTDINPSELGAFTNNLSNKEGIKKLCEKVNEGGGVEYTAGDNIQISAENVISATDTKYTAGTNVQISEQNVISATDTKYTAGTNVSISEQNVISAEDTKYTAGSGITISEQNVISATGGGGGGGDWTLYTGSDIYTDLFTINGPYIAKKDIFIYYEGGTSYGYPNIRLFIPKGSSYNGGVYSNACLSPVSSSATTTSEIKFISISFRSSAGSGNYYLSTYVLTLNVNDNIPVFRLDKAELVASINSLKIYTRE